MVSVRPVAASSVVALLLMPVEENPSRCSTVPGGIFRRQLSPSTQKYVLEVPNCIEVGSTALSDPPSILLPVAGQTSIVWALSALSMVTSKPAEAAGNFTPSPLVPETVTLLNVPVKAVAPA